MVLLLLVEEKELYGYELVKRIKDIADIETSEGTIYPILNRLVILTLAAVIITGVFMFIIPQFKPILEEMTGDWNSLVGSIKLLLERR